MGAHTTPSGAEVADYLKDMAARVESIARRLYDPAKGNPESVDPGIGLASSDLRFVALDMRRRAELARRGEWERPTFMGPREKG